MLGVGAWLLCRGGPEEATPATDEARGGGPAQAVLAGERKARPELLLSPRVADRAAIAGTVRDPRGAPVAGAQVCAFARSNMLASNDTRKPSCATSGRDGHYRIEGLFAVRHTVRASAPGYIPGVYFHGEGADRREVVDLKPGMEALGIDIALEDGGIEIQGTVKDLSGGPIEGAQVVADLGVTWTGADGVFSLWVRPGNAWVVANADGYARGHDDGVVPGHTFEVFLTPEAVLVGRVVRAGEGTPVEGARVTAQSGSWGWNDNSTFTDASGKFRLDGLEPGAYKARAESDEVMGLAAEQVILGLGETSAPIVIEAHPAFYVEGTIVIEGGSGCDAGNVSLRDPAQDRSAWQQSEPDGTVRVRGLLPGEYRVEVHCEGYVSEERYDRVTIADKSVSGLKWTVSKGQAIRGVVVDASGKPVRRMQVSASAKPDPNNPRAHQTNSWGADTDEQGRFEIKGLLAGGYDLSLYAWQDPRAVPLKPTPVTVPKGQDVEDVRIELPATGELRGTIRDAKGRPVKDVQVLLRGGADSYNTQAADDGSFHFAHVAAGEYRAVSRRGWFDSMRAPGTSDDDVQGELVEIRAGKTESVKLVVEDAAGTITGIVRDEDGAPVADAFVEASRESDSAAASAGRAVRWGRWGSFFDTPHLTDVDGRFTLESLSVGKHTIRAHRKGGGEAILEHVEVGGDVVLTIASTGRMSGTVSVRGGAPPDEFQVRIVDETTGFERHDSFFRTGGAWSLAEVPPGNYKVRVSAGPGTAEVEATMSAGQDTAGVKVELAPKVTVRGKVVDLEGNPVPGLEVAVNAKGMWSFGGADEDKHHVTDEQGRFEIAQAPTGAVRVSVYPRSWGGDNEFEWTSMPAEITADEAVVELAPIRVTRKRVKEGEAEGDLGYKLKESEPGEDPMKRRLIVAFVRPNGPAAAAGLQAGDEILTVDGQDVTGPNAYLYRGLTRVLEGTKVTLGLGRGASLELTASKKP